MKTTVPGQTDLQERRRRIPAIYCHNIKKFSTFPRISGIKKYAFPTLDGWSRFAFQENKF